LTIDTLDLREERSHDLDARELAPLDQRDELPRAHESDVAAHAEPPLTKFRLGL
jgi:hypothetical protein